MTTLRVAIAYDCLYPVNTGGGERVYRRMAELLVERGHKVDYLTRRQWDGAAPDASFRVVPVWSGEIYDDAGGRLTSAAVGFARALSRYLRRHRHDYDLVIVSALPVLNVFGARAALLGSRTHVVTDWLEVWPWRKWREYSGALVGSAAFFLQVTGLRIAGDITVNSSFTRARVRRYRRRSAPVVLGLLDLVGAPGPTPTVPVDGGLALFAGRHIPDKQLASLPAAIAVARRSRDDVHLVVAGAGPETQRLRDAVAASGQEAAIRIVGRVDDDELDRLMASAGVLVNPSRREGFGLVVAEAAARGTPSVVVAGEDNAAAELVHDGVNGFVAESVSADDLGSAILRVLDAGEGLRVSTLGWFERARETQNLARSVDELLARYEASRAR
ncbi:glycosyltransferase family 4 protein [Diaminobutyricibacter tongyongensis]|uniref:D-inositol 3-phosphate glycosyltransferase n=1 Tax=Leifsonia tongyongensis TaxID=1268043 RepID=A0A6L9Y000_9MICO|nr:glycosyltransferase family 4 protein [Diaminobutyricibacter tongyongensis]